MKRHISYILSICLVLFFGLSVSAQDEHRLSGQAKLGYVFIDDDGKMSTTQEIFNLYSGFTLQNLSLRGFVKKNYSFELDLSDINRDNRSLFFSFRKPGLFALNSRMVKSRFVFDDEGKVKSFRTQNGLSAYLQPAKFLKLRGDYFEYVRKGDRRTCYDSLGAWGGEYDQFLWSAGFGGQLKSGKRFVDFEYRLRSFNDKKNDLQDREGSRIRTSLNTPLSQNAYLSLQYLHDENELEESELELKSDLYKSSLIYHPARQVNLSAKFMFQRTENQSTQITSDVLKGAGEISYQFYIGYRFNLGYERERREHQAGTDGDETKVTVNSYLVGAFAQVIPELSLKARYVFQDRKDEDAATLTGPCEDERILIQLKSRPLKEINLKLRYEDKRRDNPDISSSVCDKGFVVSLSVAMRDWLGFQFNYSLLDVKYVNTEGKFETDNNTFTSEINLRPCEKFSLTTGWNHVDIRGDLDIRKEGGSLGFDCALRKNCSLQGRYDAYDYDDFTNISDFYAANVYTISLVKKFGGI